MDHADAPKAALPSSLSRSAANARALAFAMRPDANTAHISLGGRVHSLRIGRTAPDASSAANIHSGAIASPIPLRTAARTPSLALTRRRPEILTDIDEASCRKVQVSLPPRSWV